MGPDSFYDDCSDTFLLADEPGDIFFLADRSDFCSDGLTSPSLCTGVSYNGDQATIVDDAIVVFNTGGCQDKIKLEVSLSGIFQGPGECISPLTLKCEGLTTFGEVNDPVDDPANDSANDPVNDPQGGDPAGNPTGNDDPLDESCASCLAALFTDEVNIYYGDCGALSQKTEDKWCYDSDLEESICCGSSSSDCCEPKVGAVVGISIGLLLVLIASILGCCACCTCCPMYSRFRGGTPSNNTNSDEKAEAKVEMAQPEEAK
jgi:hypothetical protein